MAKRHREDTMGELPGQDSFLDIVANIVGILILLVVIVGIRAATFVAEKEKEPVAEVTRPALPLVTEAQIVEVYHEARRAVGDATDLRRKQAKLDAEAEELDYERELLATYVASADEELKARRQRLADDERSKFDLRVELVSAEEQLDKLTRKQIALATTSPESVELENVPTPIARRVEGEEVALRLEGGKVAEVPFKRLIAELEGLGRSEVRRQNGGGTTQGRIGPINGFAMFHTLVSKQTVGMTGVPMVLQFVVAEIRPAHNLPGEPVEEAVQPSSQLMTRLAGLDPRTTSVTIWVYPDSFESIGKLRNKMYEQGFATALRPLAEGTHIGLSPFGSKSRAQ